MKVVEKQGFNPIRLKIITESHEELKELWGRDSCRSSSQISYSPPYTEF